MKGRTWCIEFLDDAKKAGTVSTKWKVLRQGQEQELNGSWEGYQAGMTARAKADRFYNMLKNDPGMSRLVNVTRSGNTVCFRLTDAAPYDDVLGVKIGDETGQTFRVFDDPVEEHKETVRFRLQGEPVKPESVVRLGVGRIPSWAEVSTHVGGEPLSIPAIMETLADRFNEIFGELGWLAKAEEDEVIIPSVPCEDGCTGGTDDPGLTSELSIQDPETTPFLPGLDKIETLREHISLLSARLAAVEGRPTGPSAQPPAETPRPHNPCRGIGIELDGGAGAPQFFLACDGECDTGECEIRQSRDHHGSTREWCGCSDVEPSHCHLVIYRPGPGSGGGSPEVVCAGSCEGSPQPPCRLVRIRITPPGIWPQIFINRCTCS